MNEDLQTNQRNWDDRVAGHMQADGYDPERFVRDRELISQVVQMDREALGDLKGKRVLHLQCHIGTDSLSLARLGAEVTGLDFSSKAIEAARGLCAAAGEEVRFVEASVYDAVAALEGETFDLVYTSVGIYYWLPDLPSWAKVVASCLKPGGRFVFSDEHPTLGTLDEERKDGLLVITEAAFGGERTTWNQDKSYSGSATLTETQTVAWAHGIGDILSAVLSAGLRLDTFVEKDSLTWASIPILEEKDGLYRLPENLRSRCPLAFQLTASKD